MPCILEGGAALKDMSEVGEALGMSLPPMVNKFCEPCNSWHVIETGEYGDQRYGMTPVDVTMKREPEKFKDRTYCHTCHAYGHPSGVCPGERVFEDWGKKEIV